MRVQIRCPHRPGRSFLLWRPAKVRGAKLFWRERAGPAVRSTRSSLGYFGRPASCHDTGMGTPAVAFMTQPEAVPQYGTVRVTIDGARVVPYTHHAFGSWAAWLVWGRAAGDGAPLPMLHVMPQRCAGNGLEASFDARQNYLAHLGLAQQDISKITQLTPRETDLRDRIAITGAPVLVVITELTPTQLPLAQRQQLAREHNISVHRIDAASYMTQYMRATELENDSRALNERLGVTALALTVRIDVADLGA